MTGVPAVLTAYDPVAVEAVPVEVTAYEPVAVTGVPAVVPPASALNAIWTDLQSLPPPPPIVSEFRTPEASARSITSPTDMVPLPPLELFVVRSVQAVAAGLV